MMWRSRTIALGLVVLPMLSACGDDDPTDPGENEPGAAVIASDITTSRTLYADTVYTLRGFIHVANGATLTIQPGTVIQGDAETLGSSLFIMRGAKIMAQGTADRPIVFTSSRPANSRAAGDWGGVIIIGNARVNRSGVVTLEGTGTNATTNPALQYSGGSNDADNSGVLEYVRIEFAGYATAADQELNTLTLAAVGSGTRIQYVQALAGLDDAFEFFGGAVDGKYLVSYETGDDHFDMSEGYRGRLQYLIAYQTQILTPRPGAGLVSTDPQGIENDGCAPGASGCDGGLLSAPLNTPVVANFTLIGRGTNNILAAGDYGMVLRRGTGGFYVNGVVARFGNAGISVRDPATQTLVSGGDLTLSNILLAEEPRIYQTGQQVGVDAAANNLVMTTSTAASLFTTLPTGPTNGVALDWTPSATSDARTGGLATFSGKLQAAAAGAVAGTSYRGAVDPNGPKWWQGWTRYAIN